MTRAVAAAETARAGWCRRFFRAGIGDDLAVGHVDGERLERGGAMGRAELLDRHPIGSRVPVGGAANPLIVPTCEARDQFAIGRRLWGLRAA